VHLQRMTRKRQKWIWGYTSAQRRRWGWQNNSKEWAMQCIPGTSTVMIGMTERDGDWDARHIHGGQNTLSLSLSIYCNMFAGSIFKMEVYYTPEFNTQLLITVHNSSRILTLV
jgi:hypothetical protein